MFLEDRADAVKGHFAIARNTNKGHNEYWNDPQQKWVGWGSSVYIGEKDANEKMKVLQYDELKETHKVTLKSLDDMEHLFSDLLTRYEKETGKEYVEPVV